MRALQSAGLLALSAVANAFTDSSPFVLLSTAELGKVPSQPQLQTGKQVLKEAQTILSSCPTERYLLVSQPNVKAADLRAGYCAVPSLCGAIASDRVRATYSVAEVVGDIGIDTLADHIKSACSKKGIVAKVDETKLAPLPSKNRAAKLGDNDHILRKNLDSIQLKDSYTIIYLSSPSEPTYEAEFTEPLHMELKRDSGSVPVRRASNNTDFNKLPLFEKYQFFTPGIFMGLLAALFMLAIASVGLRALGSLQVSYSAFDKEMGPAAQKKQM